MRTPRFSVEQDDDFLTIKIHVPFCDLKQLEIDIENENFMFYCKPYFLRLNLPGKIKETDSSSGKFIADTQDFIFKIEKYTKGEYFPDLDMLTKLLQPPINKANKPTIEVIANNQHEPENDDEQLQSDSDQWYVEQNVPDDTNVLATTGYGFGNKITGNLDTVQIVLFGIVDDIETIKMTPEQRTKARQQFERKHFDKKIYLYQYFIEDDVEPIINCLCPWEKIVEDLKTVKDMNLDYTEYEIDTLKELPNKEFLLSNNEEYQILLGLIDILYAYCYDKRMFLYENSVELGWATNKISSTLSWFDSFQSVSEVLIANFRRSLIFPLYRNFKLSLRVFEDLKLLLSLGKKFILKCLIEIMQLFNMGTNTDPRYILNDLYIKDYIIFVQKCDNTKLDEIIEEINNLAIKKKHLDLNLLDIEEKAIKEILNVSSDDDSTSSFSSSSYDSDDTSSSESESDTESKLNSDLTEINEQLKNVLF